MCRICQLIKINIKRYRWLLFFSCGLIDKTVIFANEFPCKNSLYEICRLSRNVLLSKYQLSNNWVLWQFMTIYYRYVLHLTFCIYNDAGVSSLHLNDLISRLNRDANAKWLLIVANKSHKTICALVIRRWQADGLDPGFLNMLARTPCFVQETFC